MYDVFVIKGNTAVFKCQIPSFVSDHVEVISWQDMDNNKYLPPTSDYGKLVYSQHLNNSNSIQTEHLLRTSLTFPFISSAWYLMYGRDRVTIPPNSIGPLFVRSYTCTLSFLFQNSSRTQTLRHLFKYFPQSFILIEI